MRAAAAGAGPGALVPAAVPQATLTEQQWERMALLLARLWGRLVVAPPGGGAEAAAGAAVMAEEEQEEEEVEGVGRAGGLGPALASAAWEVVRVGARLLAPQPALLLRAEGLPLLSPGSGGGGDGGSGGRAEGGEGEQQQHQAQEVEVARMEEGVGGDDAAAVPSSGRGCSGGGTGGAVGAVGGSGRCCGRAPHRYDLHLLRHPLYQVPAALLRGRHADGSPLAWPNLAADFPAWQRCAAQGAGAPWGLVTPEEHPLLQGPAARGWHLLHPCMTAAVVGLALAAGGGGAPVWPGPHGPHGPHGPGGEEAGQRQGAEGEEEEAEEEGQLPDLDDLLLALAQGEPQEGPGPAPHHQGPGTALGSKQQVRVRGAGSAGGAISGDTAPGRSTSLPPEGALDLPADSDVWLLRYATAWLGSTLGPSLGLRLGAWGAAAALAQLREEQGQGQQEEAQEGSGSSWARDRGTG